MRIIVVEPQMKPKIQYINGSLASMQDIVGGTIQAMYPYDDAVALVVNDEGKVLGLPMNRARVMTMMRCMISSMEHSSSAGYQRIALRMNNQIVILPMLDQ